jgi:AsmA protein
MGGPLKKVLFLILGIAAVAVVAAVLFVLLFDPNDFREQIAAEVKETTGRDLVIEGDIELSLFPWLAINVGKSTLGNAAGFGDEPFASFEEARLSVKVMPMLLDRKVAIGTAALDSLQLNLAVASNGRSNWQDFIDASEAESHVDEPDVGAHDGTIDIASIAITNASVSYSDAQSGDSFRLSELNLGSGAVELGAPVAVSGDFNFELQPADFAGDFAIEAVLMLDSDAGTVAFSDVEITTLGVGISAEVAPFSYVDDAVPTATIEVDAFSLKSLMQAMSIEAPVTADPDALGKVIVDATASMRPEAIVLSDMTLVIDDTTFGGELSLASDAVGTISFNLAGDAMNVDRYMAPADEGSASADTVPVEIPADLIRSLNLRGNLTLDEATLSGMEFTAVELGLNAAGGNLRLHPISADFFGGKYQGDVRINASSGSPVLSVNENISNVDLGSLAVAMFDQENVTGTINGAFRLSGRGDDLAAIQRSLDGTMSMELIEGTWEGTDIWYELRRARALLKQEPAPEPELPARTRFSNVSASGPVTDGVFSNDNLTAQLPFMQLTGNGEVDFAAADIDYQLTARILERPEFIEGASEEELDEFTEAVIPLRISGPLADPSIKPDIEEALKEEVKKKVQEKLFEKLLGGDDEPEDAANDLAEEPSGEEEPEKKKSDKDKLKDALKDLIG